MRVLLLNIGNTSLLGGVAIDGRIRRRFRAPNSAAGNQRELAALLARPAPNGIDMAVFCSVVPALTEQAARVISSKFGVSPIELRGDSAHGLKIAYRRPADMGADRVAAALGAHSAYPGKDRIVVDFGTATTVTAVTRDGEVAGGAILPGFALWAEMLASRTAQLPKIGSQAPKCALGCSTKAAIASGLHYGHTGAVRELVARISKEVYGQNQPLVLGTGGGALRFCRENLFAEHAPDLILLGLNAFAYA